MKLFRHLQWHHKRDLDTLNSDDLLKRARRVGLKITDLYGGTGDLAEHLAVAQYGIEAIREQIRSKEREIEARRMIALKKIALYIGIIGGIVGLIWTLIQIKDALTKANQQSVQY